MKSWDFLNSLTKNEIIQFLNKEFWIHAPEKHRIDWFLNQMKFENYMKRQEKHDSISLHGMTLEQSRKHFEKDRKLEKEYKALSRESERLLKRMEGE